MSFVTAFMFMVAVSIEVAELITYLPVGRIVGMSAVVNKESFIKQCFMA